MFQKAARVLTVVLAVCLLAGCGSGGGNTTSGGNTGGTSGNSGGATAADKKTDAPSGDTSGGAASGDQVTIKFMTWEGEAMNAAMVESMAPFMEAHPGIKVELEPSPLTDYGIKLQEMLASGTAPDIFMAGNDMALNYDEENLVVDLKPYMDKNPDFANGFYPGVMTTYTKGEKIVGLPGLVNMYGVFYNKKFFKDAGVPEPTMDWTFDDMLAAAEKLKDPASQRYGLYMTPDVFATSLYSASKDGTGFCDNIYPVTKVQASDAFKEGVQKLQDAIKSGAVNAPTYNQDNITGNFMQGAIPMLRYGQWAADELIRNAPEGLEWAFAPWPKVSKNAQIIDAVSWCINKATKNPDQAFEVMMFLENETYATVLPKTPVSAPAFMKAAEAYYAALTEKGHPEMAEGLNYMLNAEIKCPVRFLDPWGAKASKFTDASWNGIISGELPMTELDKMVEDINGVITK